MELNYVLTIVDRVKHEAVEGIVKAMNLPLTLTTLARGTATTEHLSLYGLASTAKAVIGTVAGTEETRRLMRAAKTKLYVDIPGNGIMLSTPIKSIGGSRTMTYFTENTTPGTEKPEMIFNHELIYAIANEGFSDMVMTAARSAGATGGTVITAKGTGLKQSEKFIGISLTNERDVVLIVAAADKKRDIVKAIIDQAGPDTKAGAICFTLPVSQVAGLHSSDDDGDIE